MTTPRRPARLRPADVVRALDGLLRAAGITRIYGAACIVVGVLSVTYELTVWTDGRRLWWHRHGEQTTWPATDPDGAARILAPLAHDQAGPAPSDGA